jgi:hypothetical protein
LRNKNKILREIIMHKISRLGIVKRLMLCMLFLQPLQALDHKPVTMNLVYTGATVAALTVSLAQGVYNIRRYHFMMSQYQLDYSLSSPVYLIEYPLQATQNLICSGLPALDMSHQNKHGLAVTEISKKIALFDAADPLNIWDFTKFSNIMPHTSIKEAYCVSKSYLGSFGYPTLGILKDSVTYQIAKIEQDFKQLTSLTDLPWYFVKIPKTYQELQSLENQLQKLSHYYGAYAFLGAFGYSCVHNGDRVKNYLISLTKMHAFLVNLQELLATCMDSDETQLIQSHGVLQFSLQHVHYIERRT